jgi:hypothetical protein
MSNSLINSLIIQEYMMIKIWNCRRSSLAIIAIGCLTFLGAYVGEDVSGIAVAISGVVASVAAANSYQKAKEKQYSGGQTTER